MGFVGGPILGSLVTQKADNTDIASGPVEHAHSPQRDTKSAKGFDVRSANKERYLADLMWVSSFHNPRRRRQPREEMLLCCGP